VHLVTAFGAALPELTVGVTEHMLASLRASSKDKLERLAAARAGIATFGEPVVVAGDARDAILETAEALNADLIVMGTHGRRGIPRLVLGSTADHVVRRAPCPVLTVRKEQQP
jgi:nucleotide-binding universal stress UspA family protein